MAVVRKIGAQAGPQTEFLRSGADIAIYGGAAGGGKTFGLLLEALRHTENPRFGAVIFRRTTPQITNEGALWDESNALYPLAGGEPKLGDLSWRFPSGAAVSFAHLEHEKTVHNWHGAQVPLICFDELTHFSRAQFWYMVSRNRSTCGVRPYVRATCNPDSESWVAEFISWWINPDTGYPLDERSGVLRWLARVNDVLVWADTAEGLREQYPGCEPKSLTFIPARLEDNAALLAHDPGYRANLMALQAVDRERLLCGNWKIKPAAGLYFRRSWCEVVDVSPSIVSVVRGWDLAATPKTETNDPDATCATKIGRLADGRFIVLHHLHLYGSPAQVETEMLNIATSDGHRVRIAVPEDPAQAGKAQTRNLSRLLVGYDARFERASGDKLTRFKAFSAQAEAGNVLVLRGPWNDQWFGALETFGPDARHDDDADSTAEAFNGLTAHQPLVISDAVLARSRILVRPRP